MSKSTIESVVIFIILIIGIVGVFSIIRPSEDAFASPNHNIEQTGKPYSTRWFLGVATQTELPPLSKGLL